MNRKASRFIVLVQEQHFELSIALLSENLDSDPIHNWDGTCTFGVYDKNGLKGRKIELKFIGFEGNVFLRDEEQSKRVQQGCQFEKNQN